MNKKYILPIFMILSGCGTIFSGSTQDMSFDSNVKGVEIYVSGIKACKTPCVYPLDKGSGNIIITAKKKGYEEQQQILKTKFNNFAILNLTGWPSWLVDIATGGMWQYKQDGVYIDMEKPTKNYAKLKEIKKNINIRRFALSNYPSLKLEAAQGSVGEYITALSYLSGLSDEKLIGIINKTNNEIKLAHSLTGIK